MSPLRSKKYHSTQCSHPVHFKFPAYKVPPDKPQKSKGRKTAACSVSPAESNTAAFPFAFAPRTHSEAPHRIAPKRNTSYNPPYGLPLRNPEILPTSQKEYIHLSPPSGNGFQPSFHPAIKKKDASGNQPQKKACLYSPEARSHYNASTYYRC